MNRVKVENGVVTNIVAVDPNNIPSWCASWPVADSNAMVGGTYADGTFTPVPPRSNPVPSSITFAQLLIGLVTEAWITEAEGEAWLTGTLPAHVLSLIATLPAEQRFAAKARAITPSIVLRNDPLVASLGAAQGKTAEQLDTFFTTYAQV